MKYIEYVNAKLKEVLAKAPDMAIFGQNINAGSCIGGYTRGIKLNEKSIIINSTNTENALVGVGFGMMLSNLKAIFFMKQLDFLLLGIDQIVNTNNILRTKKGIGSFTIMPIIVDSGYEGPQSSLNTLPDFCSISSTDGYALTNKHDIDFALENLMLRPGFRIISFSQRLLKTEILSISDSVKNADDGSWFQYSSGEDLTIACFNLSLPIGYNLSQDLESQGIRSTLFSVNYVHNQDLSPIIESYKKTGKLLIIDDTKSVNSHSQQFAFQSLRTHPKGKVHLEKRIFSKEWFVPSPDDFSVDKNKILNWFKE